MSPVAPSGGAGGGQPPDDSAAGGMSGNDREALAAHLRELERLAARGEEEAAGGEDASPELRAMLERLREMVAALDALLASSAGGAEVPPPGDRPGDAPRP